MIKYFCNICTRLIKPREVNSVTIKKSTGEVAVMHFCTECFPRITDSINIAFHKADEKVENNITYTKAIGSNVERDTFDWKSFRNSTYLTLDDTPPKPHGKTDVVRLRRILLGYYFQKDLKTICSDVNTTYITVHKMLEKYASKKIAMRHIQSKDAPSDEINIITNYYLHGDSNLVAKDLGVSVSKVIELVDYYTGIIIMGIDAE